MNYLFWFVLLCLWGVFVLIFVLELLGWRFVSVFGVGGWFTVEWVVSLFGVDLVYLVKLVVGCDVCVVWMIRFCYCFVWVTCWLTCWFECLAICCLV